MNRPLGALRAVNLFDRRRIRHTELPSNLRGGPEVEGLPDPLWLVAREDVPEVIQARDLQLSSKSLASVECKRVGGELIVSPWSFIFLILLAISALFGFGGFAPAAAGIARIFVLMFTVLFVVSFLVGGMQRTAS